MTTEAQLQIQVADYLRRQYPDILFHSDYGSGVKLTARQAAVQKRQNGGRKGWPDELQLGCKTEVTNFNMALYEPALKIEAFGLFIELKKEGTRLIKKDNGWATPHIAEQAKILKRLRECGYAARFAVGFDEAKMVIDDYLRK